MLVIAGMGDVQTDFMQRGGASEILLPQGKFLNRNVFGMTEAVHKGLRGLGGAFRLIEADVVAVLELGNRLSAHIFV